MTEERRLTGEERELLALMAQVGSPLRRGRTSILFFPGKQTTHLPPKAYQSFHSLLRQGLIEPIATEGKPLTAQDYTLAEEGRPLIVEVSQEEICDAT